jgi:hypothetical protein
MAKSLAINNYMFIERAGLARNDGKTGVLRRINEPRKYPGNIRTEPPWRF